MRKDDQMLNAMYAKVHQEVIEEAGVFSRVGARLGGAYDAAKQAVGDVATAVSGKAPAPDAGWRGKYAAGKQERIIGTLTDDIINDLKKLGLISSPQDINKKELEGVLNKYLDGINANTKTPTAASREPSIPVSTPAPDVIQEPVSNATSSTPEKSAPVMGTSSTSSPVTPKSEPVESEAGEVQTSEDKAKSEARMAGTKERISNKPQPNHSKVKGKNGVEFTFKGSDEKGNQIWVDGEGNKSPAGGLLTNKWQTERESKNESFKSFWNLA
jgi:hypothetical protein